MDDPVGIALTKRWDALFETQSQYRSHCQDIANYFIPRKSNIIRQRAPGAKQNELVFNNIGGRAALRLAATLHYSLTSRAMRWFSYVPSDISLQQDIAVSAAFEQATNRTYQAFNAPESNFDSQIHETYIDLVHFGMAALLFECNKTTGGKFLNFIFKTLQVGTYVVDEGIDGIVDTLGRKFQMSARSAEARFGADVLPTQITNSLKDKPDKMFDFLHWILPATDYARAGGKTDKKFASVYLSVIEKKIVREAGYNTFPVMVPRWYKTSGEMTGRSPAMDALPDVRTLNVAEQYDLDAWAYDVRPPLLVEDDGVIGDIDYVPGGLVIKRKGAEIAPLTSGAHLQYSEQRLSRKEKAIADTFFYNEIGPMEGNGKHVAAEWIIEMRQRIERNTGPMIGRVETELLNPLVMRAWDVLNEAGEFGEYFQGAIPAVRYDSALSRQQRAGEVDAILQTRALAERIAVSTPDVMDNLNADEEFRLGSDILGYPKSARVDEKQVGEIRAKREQQHLMQTAPETIKTASEAAKNFAAANPSGVQTNGAVPQ